MREPVVDALARVLIERADRLSGGALRVAVTGITASGKSTLAAELARRVRALGVPSVYLEVDGFHNPRAIRHRRGRDSAEGYYRDAYDHGQLVARVLTPLAPGGDLSYVSRVFDLERDEPVVEAPLTAPRGSVFLLAASFLLRPELREHFDYRILVEASFAAAEARGVERDASLLGGAEEARRLYRARYHEAHRIHFREASPDAFADALFVNEDVLAPVLLLRDRETRWDGRESLPTAPLAVGPLASRFRALGLASFGDATGWVQELPYGRNRDRASFTDVLAERRGTCSTKHALLAALALEQGIEVELRLGLYEMDARNTPGVGAVLSAAGLHSVPEAHCYLACAGTRVDLTRPDASPSEPIRILLEERIAPEQIGEYKLRWHEAQMRRWAETRGAGDWREVWRVREACIAALSGAR